MCNQWHFCGLLLRFLISRFLCKKSTVCLNYFITQNESDFTFTVYTVWNEMIFKQLIFWNRNKLLFFHGFDFKFCLTYNNYLLYYSKFPAACLNRKFRNEILQTYLRWKNTIDTIDLKIEKLTFLNKIPMQIIIIIWFSN